MLQAMIIVYSAEPKNGSHSAADCVTMNTHFFEFSLTGKLYSHNIYSPGSLSTPMCFQIRLSRSNQLALLCQCHCLLWQAISRSSSRLNLYESNIASLFCNNINLTCPAVIILHAHQIPSLAQSISRKTLASSP